ncbi:MAG TPA: efflux RND transporter periplasmic adaptor subunit [Gemmataceae bacterium]|nr:efflux RND transporter periplasmic adaptor subunit [Gemmataceae bacterium]
MSRPVTDVAEFTGRTMAVESVKLRARVWGHLQKINFAEGGDVKKNDILFVIDQRSYKAALTRAESEVAQAEARYKRLLNDQRRADGLAKSKAISQEDYDKITGDLAEAAAMKNSAAANREVARLNLEFTEVKAPISGHVSRAMVTVGNMVESGETGGTVLTTIMSTDPMYAYFDVDDQTWVKIRDQVTGSAEPAKVHLSISSKAGYQHVGKLDFVDNQIDAGTGTMRMRGIFPNSQRLLTPGLFVRIRLPLGAPHNGLLITERAIDSDQGQKVVYVVNGENQVEKRAVKLGSLHDGLREVTEGLSVSDQVIIEGIQRVRPGMPVVPELIEMPAAK